MLPFSATGDLSEYFPLQIKHRTQCIEKVKLVFHCVFNICQQYFWAFKTASLTKFNTHFYTEELVSFFQFYYLL